MCLKLNDYQFKTSRYSYRSTYMNSVLTTDQKSAAGTQDLERKEHKHTTEENHQTTKEETKRRKNREQIQKQPETK